MPLARVALYQKGITIYISPRTPRTTPSGRQRSSIAIEGKCYFINSDMIVRRSSYPADIHEREMVEQLPEYVCRGGSCVIDPTGTM